MKKTEVKVAPVPLTVREIDMAIHGLRIWRQVIVAQTFSEFRGAPIPYSETLSDIDGTIEKLEQAKGE